MLRHNDGPTGTFNERRGMPFAFDGARGAGRHGKREEMRGSRIASPLSSWRLQRSQIGFSWRSAASSMVSLLIWVYYSSLIVLFGAELTQVWSNRFGSGTRPTHGAARMVQETHRVRDQPPLDGDSGPI